MLMNNRFKTTLIAYVLLLSIFTTIFTVPYSVKGEDEGTGFSKEELAILERDLLFPHPFRHVGLWEYSGNETQIIEGDISFDLYFTSTLLTQIGLENYLDKINVSIYSLNDTFSEMSITGFSYDEIANATANKTLEPTFGKGIIQSATVTIKNIKHVIHKGDVLLFVIKIDQSDKILSDYVAKQYNKVRNLIENIGELCNKSRNFKDVSDAINILLSSVDEFNLKGDDFGALVNAFTSSAFCYGSDEYNSSIKFSTNKTEKYTLYFQNQFDYNYTIEFPYAKIVNKTNPTNKNFNTYPPVNYAGIPGMDEEEWLTWFTFWAVYALIEPPIEDDENKVTYYLHDDESMTTTKPEGNGVVREKLTKDGLTWVGPEFDRNKILKNVTADLYLHYPKFLTLGTVEVQVTLYNGDKELASVEKAIDRTSILELLKRGPDSPTEFTLELKEDEEIINGNNLSLTVAITKEPLLSLRSTKILFDSENYDSSVTLKLEETDNIKIETPEDKIVYAGGSAKYVVNITSEYADKLKFSVESATENWEDNWEISKYPTSINIGAGGKESVIVFVNSTAEDDSAYGDTIELLFNVSGKTGIDSKTSVVKVSEFAVEYGIEFLSEPESLEIKHGENGTYTFIIRNKNKGYLRDTYELSIVSENGFKVLYDSPFVINDFIKVYDESKENPVETRFNVTVVVPKYTDIDSDELTITITSIKSSKNELIDKNYTKTFTVTTEIITPNILENIYHIFENAAESMGLNASLGEYAGAALIVVIVIIVAFFVIIILIISRRKFVEVICLDRIKEISSDETAVYDITVKNTYKREMTYDIKTESQQENKWDITLDVNDSFVDKNHMTLQPGQSQVVRLNVKPTDYVTSDEWIEVKVHVRPTEKTKAASISTMTSIKEGKAKLEISGVLHWPKDFKKGDRVETSFKVSNRGNVTASNVTVILYVNGEEKNKVENITIPRGGYADIEIPWIAEKGKNEVNIVVK